jgi:enoyl-CoA hydratase/carnithine racemase
MDYLSEVKQKLVEMREGGLIQSSLKNGVLEIVLNRPKKYNAFTLEMYKDLETILNEGSKNPEVKVVLLHANGPNFSSGNDLSNFLLFPEVLGDKEVRLFIFSFQNQTHITYYI